jgi:lysozyme
MDALKVRKMFVRDEGLKLKPYTCSAGRLTVGVGHNIQDNGISEAVAYQMLAEDVQSAEKACISIFGKGLWDKWSENRRLGWVNFAFNVGFKTMLSFRNTLRCGLREDWAGVEAGIRKSAYAKQVGSRADRVIAMICKEEFPYA